MVHLDPGVLLIDEALAVGDECFQRKYLERMEGIRRRGRTAALVSHDMARVERMRDRAYLLVRGHVETEGEAVKMGATYRGVC